MKNRTFTIITLGCSKNQVDSEFIAGQMAEYGYILTGDMTAADVIIVNTCGFLQSAVKEAIRSILELAEMKNNGNCDKLVVCGCLVQRYAGELAEALGDEVDLFLGVADYWDFAKKINELDKDNNIYFPNTDAIFIFDHTNPRMLLYGQHYAYLKISDGCANNCTYCMIPSIRGGLRSRDVNSVVKEATMLIAGGIREIIIIGQDIASYGYDHNRKDDLTRLVEKISKLEGDFRIRLMYANPAGIDDSIINCFKCDKVYPYLDMPLQHISSNVLRRMGRPDDSASIIKLIEKMRNNIPNLVIRTTLMVGFPGETDEDFHELIRFVNMTKFERVGAFKYSREAGSIAASLPEQIAAKVKNDRYKELMLLQKDISYDLNKKMIGKELEVLFEQEREKGRFRNIGRSYRDAPEVDGNIQFKSKKALEPGSFVKVKISSCNEYDLMGEVVDESC